MSWKLLMISPLKKVLTYFHLFLFRDIDISSSFYFYRALRFRVKGFSTFNKFLKEHLHYLNLENLVSQCRFISLGKSFSPPPLIWTFNMKHINLKDKFCKLELFFFLKQDDFAHQVKSAQYEWLNQYPVRNF